jgi:predicted nucleotide-binding protein
MPRPRMFIGSSVEGLPIAASIQEGLEHDVESTIWSQGDSTYIIYRQDLPMDLPTDLAGITAATFLGRSDENLQAAVGPACNTIRRAIREVLSTSAQPSLPLEQAKRITALEQALSSQNASILQLV